MRKKTTARVRTEATDAAAAVPQKKSGPEKPARTKKEPPDKRRACRRRASNAQSAAGARTQADEPARTGYGGPARAGPGDTEAPKPAKAAGAASTIRHVQESCLGCEKSQGRPVPRCAALQTRNSRPGRGRWPMNRRGQGTGARPAPGRAIRKRGNGAENRHKTRREQSNAGRTAVRTVQQHERMGRIRPISRAVPTGKRTKIAMTAYAAHMRGRKDFYERRASICMAVRASAYAQGGRQTFRLLFPRDDYVPANRLVDPVRKFQPRAAVLHGKAGVRKECGDLCARQNEYVP